MKSVKEIVLDFQEFYLLFYRGSRGIFERPFYGKDFEEQMEYMGADALAIVVVLAGFIGMALSLQVGDAFADLGLQSYLGTPIGISIVSEIGPVLIGILFAGRNGAGIASELGSMVLGNQVDTLRVFGVDPVKKLVTPRIMASIIMLPCLTIIGDAVALMGGAFITAYFLNSSASVYWQGIRSTFELQYIASGIIKPVLFGGIVASVGCYRGLHTRGGSRGLRNATTRAFVTATLLIIIADFIVTKLLLVVLGGTP